MSSLRKIARLASKFEQKLSLAQNASAQTGDIEDALKSAGLWVPANDIAPLLNVAKVPETVSVSISIVVDKNLNVKFLVQTNPAHPSSKALAAKLDAAYSKKMSQALKDSHLAVADTITAKLANFA